MSSPMPGDVEQWTISGLWPRGEGLLSYTKKVTFRYHLSLTR